ncbi:MULTISPECIES: energy-coupling factor transporter transmembrane component T family protein [Pasteurellaceae]|uniref:Energy-coupling factor transporter transmembrane protein EcfT n=1 Tax=Pasteurella atlantica TaxID=2827233 RepID=A0AAW8CKK4_9PAST|nr:energy-coupling factor transporter transmembrane protein EcfT [Pasteurella atlantica]MBR0573286.1 energy-coupling factor transporter transmembrane protein EcfT [Pasteurella atlantica]MDP8039098.1 energy-coupling factor transporter transmembrane protein EcfT [Pasteurella atlantica]MDP8041303.1 energy-coupling factor transporter transmembrane protein EcfT [Pasteurella atlantica]MDP8043440.1 energy-coupling factor transporter transmembrane protein EcfT [Pasteurella atlantica]MDP8045526.1 energ
MSLSLYVAKQSCIHNTPIQIKFLCLIILSTMLFVYPYLPFSLISLLIVCLLFLLAKFTIGTIFYQIKPILPFLIILFLCQLYISSFIMGLNVVIRLSTILLLASLLTLTTKSSIIIEAIEKHLYWLKYININPKKVGLAISLTLRFIPMLSDITKEVKEAQSVRGLETNIFAIAIPVIIRTLKMADEISAAIDARAFD